MLLFNSKSFNLKRWSFDILPPTELRDIGNSDLGCQMVFLFVDVYHGYSLW